MEPIPAGAAERPMLSAGDAFRESCKNLATLINSAKWTRKTRPRAVIATLKGLSRHPFRQVMVYQDLPTYFPTIKEALEGILGLIIQTRWLPEQFPNVQAAIQWLHGVIMSLDLPRQEKEKIDESDGAQIHDFVRGGAGKDCGPADWPEVFEGFDESNGLGKESESEGAAEEASPSY